jgi:isoaspartyl peptidase/L-asparaginase-like protein (Ntn-hydrolase superfamily)
MPDYVAIATWPFGRAAVEAAAALLKDGQAALDAALAGAQVVEDDPKNHYVGYGGLADAAGDVTLDGCVMDGKTLSCGAVAALRHVRHAAAVARRVMDKTPHVLLVGEGAHTFAVQQGFPLETLNTPESVAEWEKTRPGARKPKDKDKDRPAQNTDGHDTVTVLALDKKGSLGGVCSTSGLPHKLPGRVGDSPLIGHGLYVDDAAGAAGATGVGEEIIRSGGALLIVEGMRAGKTPQEACEAAVRRVNALAVRRGVHPAQVAFLALDARGRIGGAATETTNFEFAVARPAGVELVKAKEIGVEGK